MQPNLWVTKTDLAAYLDCPQGYYLSYLLETGLEPANGIPGELLQSLHQKMWPQTQQTGIKQEAGQEQEADQQPAKAIVLDVRWRRFVKQAILNLPTRQFTVTSLAEVFSERHPGVLLDNKELGLFLKNMVSDPHGLSLAIVENGRGRKPPVYEWTLRTSILGHPHNGDVCLASLDCAICQGPNSSFTINSFPILVNDRILECADLKIRGQPCATCDFQGQRLPVLMSTDRGKALGCCDVRHEDVLFLGFYWLLMNAADSANARGCVLRHQSDIKTAQHFYGKHYDPIEIVEIPPAIFTDVRMLVERIREVRENGVPPRICTKSGLRGRFCKCSFVGDELSRIAIDNKHVSIIKDTGPSRIDALEEIGIFTCQQLIVTDSMAIVQSMQEVNCRISANQVDKWKHHARSYLSQEAVSFCEIASLRARA